MPDQSRPPACRRPAAGPPPSPPSQPAGEPQVRRWPHPVERSAPQAGELTAREIRGALAEQNQLLGEIRSLLERIAASGAQLPNA